MSYFALAQAAIGAAAEYSTASMNRKLTTIRNRVARTNAEAANTVRTASNRLAKAEGDLARWMQSVNNNRVLDNGGQAIEALRVNALRSNDAARMGQFATAIRHAEAVGGQAAVAALNGMGGSVADAVASANRLRMGINEAQTQKNIESAQYDQSRKIGSVFRQVVGSLDTSTVVDRIDYNVNEAQQQFVDSKGTLITGAILNFLGNENVQASVRAQQGSPKSAPAQTEEQLSIMDARDALARRQRPFDFQVEDYGQYL